MVLKNKKGLSTVIATLLMILLVMVATSIIWGSISKLVKDKTEKSKSCFDIGLSEKIRINEEYTCYNTEDALNKKVQFSITLGDIEIESLLISISAGGNSKSYTLTNSEVNVFGLVNYPDGSNNVKLPPKNGGLTYVAEGFTADEVESIKIAPTIDEALCDVADTITQIVDCNVLV